MDTLKGHQSQVVENIECNKGIKVLFPIYHSKNTEFGEPILLESPESLSEFLVKKNMFSSDGEIK
ncbi:MAG: hypothetical protein PHU81_02240 [Acidobacteriota bacterium]|nr:hypothetical protein [Acidobacteriota bacterium]